MRGWQGGIAMAVIIGGVGLSSLVVMMGMPFGSKEVALLSHLALGLALGGGGAIYAAWNRSVISQIMLVVECTIIVWGAFLGGVGAWFPTWQAMPNAPDAAINDTGINGAVLIGWIPAATGVGGGFWIGRLVFRHGRHAH